MTGWETFFKIISSVGMVFCFIVLGYIAILLFGYTAIRIFTVAYWRSKLDVMKRHKQEEGED